jgi:hypothetical protein
MDTPVGVYFHKEAVCIWVVVRLFCGGVELFDIVGFIIYLDIL